MLIENLIDASTRRKVESKTETSPSNHIWIKIHWFYCWFHLENTFGYSFIPIWSNNKIFIPVFVKERVIIYVYAI